MPRYVRAVMKELELQGGGGLQEEIDTVFFGGGTPTVLTGTVLADLLQTCRKWFSIRSDAEISIEANPGTVTAQDLIILKEAGVNRISYGIQTLIDAELSILGRRYKSVAAKMAVVEARAAGFDNISIDLMYGIPSQDCRTWEKTLQEVLELDPDHLSCYQLTIENDTDYAKLAADGKIALADEDVIEQMDTLTSRLCSAAGYLQYEISNFAKPGKECRHNINYWHNGIYYAVGAGAVSYINGTRQRRVNFPHDYCQLVEADNNPVIEEETLVKDASFRESVVMGLRMKTGVSRKALLARYGVDVQEYYGDILTTLLRSGLIEMTPTTLSLTDRGFKVANRVMVELV